MRKKILVVDDDPLYAELVKDVLEMHQHTVAVALSGAEALSLLSTQHFDVVISDIEMPVMNGIAFHAQAQKLREIPFVFLTATEDTDKLQYIREHTAAVILSKLNMVERLMEVISNITTPR